jgi:hypothetical protein
MKPSRTVIQEGFILPLIKTYEEKMKGTSHFTINLQEVQYERCGIDSVNFIVSSNFKRHNIWGDGE